MTLEQVEALVAEKVAPLQAKAEELEKKNELLAKDSKEALEELHAEYEVSRPRADTAWAAPKITCWEPKVLDFSKYKVIEEKQDGRVPSDFGALGKQLQNKLKLRLTLK